MRHPGRADGQDPVTIADVAAAAAVSTATVSRVLTGADPVGPALALRVQEAVARLGYAPNPAARALASLHSGLVGIQATSLVEHANIIAAMVSRLGEAGLGCVFGASALRQDLEGVVLVGAGPDPATAAALQQRRIPYLVCGSEGDVVMGIEIAGETVIAYLRDLGHRRIALLASGAGNPLGEPFLASIRATIARTPGMAIATDHNPATAVVCANDFLAGTVMQSRQASGSRVPDDLSVIGCGDHPLAARMVPPLTTVRLPEHALGVAAAERLLALIGRPSTGAPVRLPAKLVVRRSAGPVSRETKRPQTEPRST